MCRRYGMGVGNLLATPVSALYVLRVCNKGCLGVASNGLAWIRSRQRRLARGVLALFCLAWLQIAAVPCVMAGTAGMAATPEMHCPYCPPQDQGPEHCPDTAPATCTYPDGPQVDTRGGLAAAAAMPALVPVVTLAPVPIASFVVLQPGELVLVRRTPLAVTYCRFLK